MHCFEAPLAVPTDSPKLSVPAVLYLPETYSTSGSIEVDISIADLNLRRLLVPGDGKPLQLRTKRIILGVNFHDFVISGQDTLFGAILPKVKSSAWRLHNFADTLGRFMSGAVVNLGAVSMVLFPSIPRTWQDFNIGKRQPRLDVDGSAPLNACFYRSPVQEPAMPPELPRPDNRVHIWTDVVQERYTIQQQISSQGGRGIPKGRHVFLLIPKDRRVEQELWRRYFSENRRYVYLPEAGSWEAFCNKKVEKDDMKLIIVSHHLLSTASCVSNPLSFIRISTCIRQSRTLPHSCSSPTTVYFSWAVRHSNEYNSEKHSRSSHSSHTGPRF